MITLATPGSFMRAVSESGRLKFSLAWLSFSLLVFPSAVLMSFGLQPKYVLSVMAAAIIPFQYFCFCVLQAREQREYVAIEARGPLLSESADFGILMPELVQHPGTVRRLNNRFAAMKLTFSTGNGHQPQAAVRLQIESEGLSGQTGASNLSPRSGVCYTRA
jgi:hypothetical protein